MKKIFCILSILSITMVFSQKHETKIADQYQSKQPQDLSVPPPSRVTFPAHFPDGNKAFLKEVDGRIVLG